MVKQAALLSLVPQLLVLGLICWGYYLTGVAEFVLVGALTYLLLSLGLRNLLAPDHRRGIRQVRQHRFQEAILDFEKSYAHFTRHAWLDKYRFIFLLSSSQLSYREMALCNIAFCYSQIGDGQKAIAYYTRTLTDYPDNGMVQAGLKMLQSVDKLPAE